MGQTRATTTGIAARSRLAGCVGLLSAVLTSAVSGCSGTGAAADGAARRQAAEAVRQVPEVLAESGSSQATTDMRMASGGTWITIHGEGGFDYAERRGLLRIALPEGEPVTEVFVAGELYMKNRGAGVPSDKWVRVDVTTLPDGNVVTGGATDPITAVELLRGVSYAADLGFTEVDGETLRHYRGVTDIAAAAEAAPGAAGEQLAAAVDGFTDTEVPFDAYLDDQGLPRKIRHQFSFARGGESVDVASTVLLYDFGAPVRVELPDPGQVYTGTIE
ncbi:hypothetical protein [Streptomyces hainanensis]|uniref:hypothetical protein n=1 Tax=Streptomyces hainanensis TaxID=402648 RepID=UPI001FB7E8A8|nr:hypothetical protein [Streptomyces hainanensis]